MKPGRLRVVITGASLGLGREIATAFSADGADLFLCARTAESLDKTGRELFEQRADARQKIGWQPCDVSDERQVADFIFAAQELLGGIDVLINNAGILGPKGPSEQIDLAEWRRTLDVNLFGVLLPCRAVMPLMQAQGGGKILNLSGGGATSPLPFMSAYACSKVAVVRLTENLAEEWRVHNITVNAIAPGALNTRLLDDVLAAGPEKVGAAYFARAQQQLESGGADLQRAAQLCLYLAGPKSAGITGKLISAPWDNWEYLHEHRAELEQGDVYTLRRILSKDRGFSWGDK